MGKNIEVATLAGGCFWCLEAIFLELNGVEAVASGYTGGRTPSPTYHEVCNGDTGHAEAVQVSFDPAVLSYHDLLTVFFTMHDPTTPNRQGNDVGPQYRSAIFYHDEEQKTVARQVMREITDQKLWPDPIVTEVAPLKVFYMAEEYHQRYFEKNPWQPYCRAIVFPKVAHFRQQFVERLKG